MRLAVIMGAILAGVAYNSLPSYPVGFGMYLILWVVLAVSLVGVSAGSLRRVAPGWGCGLMLAAGGLGWPLARLVTRLLAPPRATGETYDLRAQELMVMAWLVLSLVLWMRFCALAARRTSADPELP